ncbi:hypothetical protein R1sor_020303 [Riccia sorocarpa]|uniref:F-box domain-containing protein n=1 Tax=Riccia sorocarpa TaxID=122646 RepID=A0ABD3IJ89_9MARC
MCTSRARKYREVARADRGHSNGREDVEKSELSREGDGMTFELDEETKQFLLARLVINKVRDARTLAMCSCVNRDWRQLATDETLWETLCIAEWPSLKSSIGKKIIDGRGYRSFYATRMRLDYDNVQKMHPAAPKLQLEHLIFFLDVVYQNTNVFSMVEEGQELAAKASTREMHDDIFRFSTLSTEGTEGVIVPSHATRWTKGQIAEFHVTWSVMEKKSLKSIRLINSKKGRMVGNSVVYESSLPRLSCFWHLPMLLERAEVEIQFQEEEPGLFVRRLVSMGTLNSEWCRYQTRDQALTYLEYLFSREFLALDHPQDVEQVRTGREIWRRSLRQQGIASHQ